MIAAIKNKLNLEGCYEPYCLNLGCGNCHIPGYVNIDKYVSPAVDLISDVGTLPFDNNSCQILYTSHCIEHIHYNRTPEILREWYRVLMPGGQLRIYTPDFGKMVRDYIFYRPNLPNPIPFTLWNRIKRAVRYYYGARFGKIVPGSTGVIVGHDDVIPHRALFDYRYLKGLLKEAGFKNIRRLKRSERWDIDDASKTFFSLAMEARK